LLQPVLTDTTLSAPPLLVVWLECLNSSGRILQTAELMVCSKADPRLTVTW